MTVNFIFFSPRGWERRVRVDDPMTWRVYVAARGVSWAGSAVTLVALPVLLFQRTGDAALTATVAALEAAPYLLLGLPAGALADRWDRRRTLVATSLVSAVLVASVPVAEAVGALATGHVLVVAAGGASMFVLADAAAFALLPDLVGRDRIARATGTLNTVGTLVAVLGPALGGAVVAGVGPARALTVDAASFVVAAALISRLGPLPPRAGRGPAGLRAEISAGVRYLWSHRGIRAFTLLGIGNSLTGGAVLGLVVVAAVRSLGLPASDARIGLLYAAAGAGGLVAGLVLPWLRTVAPAGRTGTAALVATWAFTLGWAAADRLWVGVVALGVWQAGNALVNLNAIVFRQEETPRELQGRVNTTARLIAWGGQPFGAALGGVLAESVGVRTALVVASCGVLASALGALVGPLRLTGMDAASPAPGRPGMP